MPPSPLGRLILFFLEVDFLDFCVGPKSFKGIEFTDFVIEDVNDYACIIHEYPACGRIAFNSLRGNSVLVAESEIDIIGKGLDVAFVGCGSNYKIIADAADFSDLKYTKSDCFFAVKNFCDFKCKFSGFHKSSFLSHSYINVFIFFQKCFGVFSFR